jgi:hypothetical protein
MLSSVLPLYLANSGIPLFTQGTQVQVLLFIPIFIIEAYIHHRQLPISWLRAIETSLTTNIISTLGGGILILLTGILVGDVLFQTSVPVPGGGLITYPLELILTLPIMFLVSVGIEGGLGRLRFRTLDSAQVSRSFWLANGVSYIVLEAIAFGFLLRDLIRLFLR